MTADPHEAGLAPFQAEVAQVALRAIAGHGFALAGAGALVAHGLISRPTEDLDLFGPTAGGPGQVSASLHAALTDACRVPGRSARACGAARRRVPAVAGPPRAAGRRPRRRPGLAAAPAGADAHRPGTHIEDAVASKVTAMIGRALPRDYIDVAAATSRYARADLLHWTFTRDPGLRVIDVAHAMHLLDRLPDAPFCDYGLTAEDVHHVRRCMQNWPRDHQCDDEGQQVHARSRQA